MPTPQTTIPSPCNSVCRIDPHTGWCLGCQRSLDEIAAWSTMENADKRRVWKLLAQRRAMAAAPAPGSAAP